MIPIHFTLKYNTKKQETNAPKKSENIKKSRCIKSLQKKIPDVRKEIWKTIWQE